MIPASLEPVIIVHLPVIVVLSATVTWSDRPLLPPPRVGCCSPVNICVVQPIAQLGVNYYADHAEHVSDPRTLRRRVRGPATTITRGVLGESDRANRGNEGEPQSKNSPFASIKCRVQLHTLQLALCGWSSRMSTVVHGLHLQTLSARKRKLSSAAATLCTCT